MNGATAAVPAAPQVERQATGRTGVRLRRALAAEAVGTFVMVAIGTGTVASAVLLGWPQHLWQVALLWAVGVFLGIRVSVRRSGAHLNPAVSLALAAFRPGVLPPRRLLPYWGAQLVGATAAGALVLALFGARLTAFEAEQGLVRGAPGSERAARMFGEYFPDPGRAGAAPVVPTEALAWEALGTAALLLVVFLVSDPRRRLAARPLVAQGLVALTVAAVIVVVAPVTQSGLNPARDLGPRLVAWAAGFGSVALPGPHAGFWVYLAGPLLGGLAGAAVSSLFPVRGLHAGVRGATEHGR